METFSSTLSNDGFGTSPKEVFVIGTDIFSQDTTNEDRVGEPLISLEQINRESSAAGIIFTPHEPAKDPMLESYLASQETPSGSGAFGRRSA